MTNDELQDRVVALEQALARLAEDIRPILSALQALGQVAQKAPIYGDDVTRNLRETREWEARTRKATQGG